jgi:tetraacyldisaccharide 4'-kinase
VRRGAPELRLREAWDRGGPVWLRAGLSALAAAYRMSLAARQAAYASGLLREGRVSVPVVSIGNLTVGGSGKTPTVELAVRTLSEMGAVPAVVSRGYGRRSQGVRVVADREGLRSTPRESGDEPYLLARRLPGTAVVVGESRYEAARVAVEGCRATAVVIDDGFQHRTLVKDVDIVVVNGGNPWGNGRLFPRGNLREPPAALRKAHLVVVTNPPGPVAVRDIERVLRLHNRRAPLVTADYRVADVWEVSGGVRGVSADLAGRRVVVLAGLASPRGFAETVRGLGAEVASVAEFPDHHWYEPGDLAAATARARLVGAEGLVTTEKDWVRLQGLPQTDLPIWVVPIAMDITQGAAAWRAVLRQALVRAPRSQVKPA